MFSNDLQRPYIKILWSRPAENVEYGAEAWFYSKHNEQIVFDASSYSLESALKEVNEWLDTSEYKDLPRTSL